MTWFYGALISDEPSARRAYLAEVKVKIDADSAAMAGDPAAGFSRRLAIQAEMQRLEAAGVRIADLNEDGHRYHRLAGDLSELGGGRTPGGARVAPLERRVSRPSERTTRR